MADFCYTCVQEVFEVEGERNDLDISDMEGAPDFFYSVCEGCGWHRFSSKGVRQCSVLNPESGQPFIYECPECHPPE